MELRRQPGVTYKCAWRMGHEIRKYMAEADGEQPLRSSGDVEAGETNVPGKRCGTGRGYRGNKSVVFGMIERGGDVIVKLVPNVRRCTRETIMCENVGRGSSVHTDELRSYLPLGNTGLRHETVNRGAEEFVYWAKHVSVVEWFLSRAKNLIRGTRVHMSSKYYQRHMKRFEYRYNLRKQGGSMSGDRAAHL